MSDDCELAELRLPGGRALTYAAYGPRDAPPVLYSHGFPGSRLEARLTGRVAHAVGVRIYAFDRPGYGGSPFQRGRRIVDWPADIEAATRVLGIGRFAALGVSGGAPYALATAWALSHQCIAAALVCGLGPVASHGDTLGMNGVSRGGFLLGRHAPAVVHAVYGAVIGRRVRARPESIFALLDGKASAADRTALADPALRQTIMDSVRTAFAQGGRGVAHELILYSRPWGFELEAIRQRVWLWHGEQDATVPVALGRAMARRLPDCIAEFPPAEAHFSLPVNRAQAVLTRLRDALRATAGGETRPETPRH
jgi:pimeloyl-ACP methyl ester carboxylesterase